MKILFVALDNLGDTILTAPVYEALLDTPGLEVSLWTKEYTAGIAPLLARPPEIFHCDPFWDKAPCHPKGPLVPFLSTIRTIRSKKFDSALILRSNWRKNLSCAAAGIKERWAAAGAFATRRLSPPGQGEHILDSYRRAVKEFTGKDPGELKCRLLPPRPARRQVRPYAAIHPFSGGPARNLPLPSWLGIIASLRSEGLEIFVIATPAEKASAGPAVGHGVKFSCDEAPDLPRLAEIIAGASVFIGNDSGPLHMAAALGTPAVGIIQRKKIPIIGPRGQKEVALAVFGESPREISPEMVAGLAKKAMA